MKTLKRTKAYITLGEDEKEVLNQAIEIIIRLIQEENDVCDNDEEGKLYLTNKSLAVVQQLQRLIEDALLVIDEDCNDFEIYEDDEFDEDEDE